MHAMYVYGIWLKVHWNQYLSTKSIITNCRQFKFSQNFLPCNTWPLNSCKGRQGELQTLKKEKYVFTVSLRGLAPDGTQQRSQWIALEKLWGKHEALKKYKVWAVIFHFWVHWLCRTGTCPLRQEPHFLSSSIKLERPLLRQQRCLANEAWSRDNSRRIF